MSRATCLRCFSVLFISTICYAAPPKFSEATRDPFSPPPTKSINGKSIAEMKSKVEKMWDDIVFEKDGKKVEYLAQLKTDAGTIEIEFYPDVAPGHVRSFIALSRVGFYDGLIFHRCIPGFVIQGGCPVGQGTGGPGYCVKEEFNSKRHERGVLSMARARPVDSAGSQFFICHQAAHSLNNQYTVFGKVTKGMSVVDEIVAAPRDARDRPFNPVKIQQARIKMK